MLIESGDSDLVKYIPWLNGNEILKPEDFSEQVIQLYSIAFHLLNLAEVNNAVQNRRKIENELSLDTVNGSWGQRLKALKLLNIDEKTIAALMPEISVEPVLTAHPTEVKRTTVLDHHRNLNTLFTCWENTRCTRWEQKSIRTDIKLVLYRLWKTGEIYLEKPDLQSELTNIIHYLVNVFPDVLTCLHVRFLNAWEEAGFNPEIINENDFFPKISFGNWVGGDRDGHPLVTARVTEETLKKLRLNALSVIRRELISLIKNLSFAGKLEDCTNNEFYARFKALVAELGQDAERIMQRNRDEVFRQYTGMLISKLALDVRHSHVIEIQEKSFSYLSHYDLVKDLKILRQELIAYKADTVAYTDVNRVILIVESLGFHLAHLDIRQNSRFHTLAVTELMQCAGLDGEAFIRWKESERLAFINEELQSNRPFSHSRAVLGSHAREIYDCYNVLYEHCNRYGIDAIGGLIVSMTRSVSDLLTVYLFARETGLCRVINNAMVCVLPVVPLFETIEDLETSPRILAEFLEHPVTKNSLHYVARQKHLTAPVQQVMIGYSDSNKDGGIFASLWTLHEAQVKLYQVGEKYGIRIQFFHGKGGTISRGAGPTHYFIDALPHSTLNGMIRLTEQGETIAQKYDYTLNAVYNLELLIAGAAYKTIVNRHTEAHPHLMTEVLSRLARKSREHYGRLLGNPGFITFFSEATPIDAIECSRMSSRPARRNGKRTVEDLRAIPWVFSWNQSRFNLTSWYGIGTALEEFYNEAPADFDFFKAHAQVDPLVTYIMLRIETSVSSMDEEIILEYASLVTDRDIKEAILALILEELDKTKRMTAILMGKPLQERRKAFYDSLLIRKNALANLHRKQISLLKKWREEKQQANSQKAEETITLLLLTINAIASAIRNTG